MIRFLIFIFVIILCHGGFGQNVLMVEKIGTSKKLTYLVGDYINIKTKANKLRLKNFLWSIEDSSIMIGSNHTVCFNDIYSVRKEIYFPKLLSKITLIAGAGYITLDIINNLINGQQVFNPTSLIIGGSLIGVGLVMIPLSQRNIHIGFKWKLKVIKPL